jgi:hypothetical protein
MVFVNNKKTLSKNDFFDILLVREEYHQAVDANLARR